ncbi:hypothetical protein [Nonomuraea sp. NPDC052265]|uniref:hypothetical protein n=1 Tax=Nonomuraea sp. NPDC052265 TaxID=3364374 RepID=UPI0037CB56CF
MILRALVLHCITTYRSDTRTSAGRFESRDGSFYESGVRTVHQDRSGTPRS